MKYKLIHLETGTLAESDKLWVLEDLKNLYLTKKSIPNHMLNIVKGENE